MRRKLMNATGQPICFPMLETERLFLRPLTLDDTDFVFRHFSDPLVARYLLDEPPVASPEEARAIIRFYLEPEGKNRNRWGVLRKADQRLIGTCGFHKWDKAHRRVEIGYDLSPDCWGQGYMTEALRAAIDNAFTRMNLYRIDALVHVENTGSNRILQKLGFRLEGVLRGYFCWQDTFHDHNFFGLLRDEWRGVL